MIERRDWWQIVCEKVVSGWVIILISWGVLFALIAAVAPPFVQVARQGEFSFLPAESHSRQAERIYQQAFDKNILRSLLVICVRRTTRDEGLTNAAEFEEQDRARKSDYDFIDNDLRPALIHILQTFRLSEEEAGQKESPEIPYADAAVLTYSDPLLGPMLISQDRKASLVIVELPSDFLDVRNAFLLREIDHLLYDNPEFRSAIPPGLEITLSGTAAVGRDMNIAAHESAQATEKVTVILVVVLLLLIYRSPLLALIPLLTVVAVVHVTIGTISLLAERQWMGAFQSMDIYIIVVLYGAGVDYCLFLIARYREELEQGWNYDQALSRALRHTFSPLVGSAGTSIIGIGLMVFSEYGKFRQVGLGISLGLLIALIATLTLTPAFLRLMGKWAFWPYIAEENPGTTPGWISPSSVMGRLLELTPSRHLWNQVAGLVMAYPGRLWLSFVAVMLPFALIGVLNFNNLSYGLLSELSADQRSVIGTESLQEHFHPGTLGPTTVLLVNRDQNFLQDLQVERIRKISDELYAQRQHLGLRDILSSAYPLGMTPQERERQAALEASLQQGPPALQAARQAGLRARVMKQYVGNQLPLGKHVTRIDLIFDHDPFQQDSIRQFEATLQKLNELLPQSLEGQTEVLALGATPSIRDMKIVTDRDQQRIAFLVLIGVYLFLVLLIRKPAISAYLILTVFFSYLVTLGVTFAVFWALDPAHFAGIDWKVRMFLFTMLIAIGEDYNLFLLARIDEERRHASPTKGVILALTRTGSIISSCGIIMAGTFAALMAGSLVGLKQLGFALAFGVLLDTFIVRPILVPCYMILLERGLFGRWARYLGAVPKPHRLQTPPPAEFQKLPVDQ